MSELIMVGQMEGYEKINRVYSPDGIAPCLTSRDYKDPPRILIEEEVMPYGEFQDNQAG